MAADPLTPRAVLLDIEGTVAPISFVYEKLFPYARIHGPSFIRQFWKSGPMETAREQLTELNAGDRESGAPRIESGTAELEIRTTIEYYLWLMDQDRKVTPLKTIQGLVWAEGFERTGLESEIFEDVPRALRRWREHGRLVGIFSSGSVLAQRQVFRHSNRGDLTPFIHTYFDLGIGDKRSKSSYLSIARSLDTVPHKIVFVSDVVAELDAALAAGMRTALSIRPGNAGCPEKRQHTIVRSFDDLP